MELTDQEHDFLQEFLATRRESWDIIPPETNEFLYNGWTFDNLIHNNPLSSLPNASSSMETGLSPALEHTFNPSFGDFYIPAFTDELSTTPPHLAASITDHSPCTNPDDMLTFPSGGEYNAFSITEDGDDDAGVFGTDLLHQTMEPQQAAACKVEPAQSSELPVFSMGACLAERKNTSKKVQGQPSKNLMAERRRRKRLNDRLSMLRSIVPKISKMDRTSILGDTIDYMKELLERIHSLREEIEVGSTSQINLMNIFKDLKPNEIVVRNSPKFEVERRNMDTKVEICCAGKPGLVLSTVSTLEALGLEIQQCVISCFNDFAMQASCSEVPFSMQIQEMDHKIAIGSEDIKQELFRNAGYGGRCL